MMGRVYEQNITKLLKLFWFGFFPVYNPYIVLLQDLVGTKFNKYRVVIMASLEQYKLKKRHKIDLTISSRVLLRL
jgi:hypothetical protein